MEQHCRQSCCAVKSADIDEVCQDPGADGPVIQAASTRALDGGTTLDAVLATIAAVSPSMRAPVLIFTYYNPIMARGLDNFCRQARDAGVSGVVSEAVRHPECMPGLSTATQLTFY